MATGLIAPQAEPAPEPPGGLAAEPDCDEEESVYADYDGHTVVIVEVNETIAYVRCNDEAIFGFFSGHGARANGAAPVTFSQAGWVAVSDLSNIRLA
jgi:hypothetical protein